MWSFSLLIFEWHVARLESITTTNRTSIERRLDYVLKIG